ncbi:hypothetical protein GCM10010440_26970 [Kitasatospora cinereorecta]
MLGHTSEARWLRHARVHLRLLFPYLPKQPGYNKRLRKAAGLIRHVMRELATDTALWTDDVWVVDSTPVECGRSRNTVKRSDLAGWAQYGYCASHTRYFRDFGCTCCARWAGCRSRSRRPGRRPTNARHSSTSRHRTHARHRPAGGVMVRVLQRILALTAAIWHNEHTGQPVMRSLTAYDH